MTKLKRGVKYTLMLVGAFFLLLCAGVVLSLSFWPDSQFSSRIQELVKKDEQVRPLSEDIYSAFRTTLQNEVKRERGMPKEGFEPYMFLEVFPGLTETDFEGAEASIGEYTVKDGRLIHKLDDSKLIHTAAKALTNEGMNTLLLNVSARLKVDLAQGGTLTKIMDALLAEPNAEPPLPEESVACTMDAKICPDGSAVGRIGPRCEFAPCP